MIGALVTTGLGGPPPAFGDAPADALHGGTGSGVKVLGHSDLGGGALNGHVAVLADHAYVGFGTTGAVASSWNKRADCQGNNAGETPGTVKVVRLVDPANPGVVDPEPDVVATISVDSGTTAHTTIARDVAAIHVNAISPLNQFTGDLLAVAVESCSPNAGFVGVNFYDVTNPASPVLLGTDDRGVGNIGTRQVSLVQRPDGRVLALEANQGGALGGINVTDATNPSTPLPIGTFDAPNGAASKKECRPFSFAQGVSVNADGTKAYAAYQDQGLFVLDVDALPPGTSPDVPLGQLSQTMYPVAEEGNSFRFVPNAAETVALATDDDLDPSATTLTVASGSAAGTYRGCEAIWGSGAPTTGPLFRRTTPSVTAPVSNVGFGCTAGAYSGFTAGNIALTERGGTCSFDARARLAQDPDGNPLTADGASAVLISNTATDHHLGGTGVLFSPDSVNEVDAGVTIPVVMITQEAGTALKGAGSPTATLGDTADTGNAWGALRVFDLTGAAPSQVAKFESPGSNVLTPGNGDFHAVNPIWDGANALVAWMSDGLRVVNVSNPSSPVGRAYYVPPAASDPTGNFPTTPLVVDVEKYSGSRYVITDINGGLYVLNVITSSSQCAGGGHADFGFASEAACLALFGADLSVTKTDSPDPVGIGEELTYALTVANAGPDAAEGVSLTDTLPSGVSFVSATPSQGTCSQSGGTVTCSLGTVAVGATATVSIVVEPNAVGTISNSASVTTTTTDANSANNTATASTTVTNPRGCTIIGTGGNDTLTGTAGNDVICGLGGNDTISGLGGDDTLIGGSGNDTLSGGNGDDTVEGGSGNDNVQGDNGVDSVTGGAGSDTIGGGGGTDTLNGVDGVTANDALDGGAGVDSCSADLGDSLAGCP